MVGKVRGVLKWADGRIIKDVIDSKIEYLLGPKTVEDEAPQQKETKIPASKGSAPKQVYYSRFEELC